MQIAGRQYSNSKQNQRLQKLKSTHYHVFCLLFLNFGIWCLFIICFLCIVFCDFKEKELFLYSPSSVIDMGKNKTADGVS